MSSMTPEVETLVLPGFDWVFQWRDDGHYRDLDPEQFRDEQAGRFVPPDDDWIPWTGTTSNCQGRGGSISPTTPRWFLLSGELPQAGAAHVRLHDGTQPAVVTLGRIWICEWFSRVQDATVTVGDRTWVMPFKRLRDLHDA
jgi:hypothetical protein